MKVVLQRVKKASVTADSKILSQIEKGILVFLAVAKEDKITNIDYLVNKIANLRIFEDDGGKMNLSSLDINAEILVVSQFTLYGDCKKGRRPSFDKASDPQKGEELYESFIGKMRELGLKVETGKFRAMMDVALVNDGPVTLILESA